MSQRYFPPASKAKMDELVANLKAAMADAHPGQQLDERGDQAGGAREARAGWT